jgi:hypothetical protein
MFRVARRVEELEGWDTPEGASRPAWLHKNEPASGELSSSELNPYVVGGLRELAVGRDGCAEVGGEQVQEPFPWKHEPWSSCHRLAMLPAPIFVRQGRLHARWVPFSSDQLWNSSYKMALYIYGYAFQLTSVGLFLKSVVCVCAVVGIYIYDLA